MDSSLWGLKQLDTMKRLSMHAWVEEESMGQGGPENHFLTSGLFWIVQLLPKLRRVSKVPPNTDRMLHKYRLCSMREIH